MRLLLVLLCIVSFPAAAQTDFFTVSPKDTAHEPLPPSGRHAVVVEHRVEVDIRSIASAPSVLRVEFADRAEIAFNVSSFSPEHGFLIDKDFRVYPDPDVPDEKLVYSWFGISDEGSLSFSVYGGRMSATLITKDAHYAVAETDSKIVFRKMNPAEVAIDSVFVSPRARPATDQNILKAPSVEQLGSSSSDVISILVVHTAAALTQAGSQAQLNAIVSESFNQSNLIISNSGIVSYRFENVASGTNLSTQVNYNEQNNQICDPVYSIEVCRYIGHRVWLRTDPIVVNLRNANNADLVVMIVAQDQGAVGVAYTQNPDCANYPEFGEVVPGCNPGAAFNNFAYSVVSVDFATSFQVFAHETGHQLGMEHNPQWADLNSSFPWSFGHNVANVNETVMSVSYDVPRSLQYSNPNVNFIGTATASGTASRWNARTGAALAPAVSEFRDPQLIDLLYRSSFEALPLE